MHARWTLVILAVALSGCGDTSTATKAGDTSGAVDAGADTAADASADATLPDAAIADTGPGYLASLTDCWTDLKLAAMPQAALDSTPVLAQAEPPGNASLASIRLAHLDREATVRAFGLWLCVLTGGTAVMATLAIGGADTPNQVTILLTSLPLILAGLRLRQLAPVGRVLLSLVVAAMMVTGTWTLVAMHIRWRFLPDLTGLGILAVMFSIPAALLALLWTGQARVVFSAHYRQVTVPGTPEIHVRSSRGPLLVGAAMVLLVAVIQLDLLF